MTPRDQIDSEEEHGADVSQTLGRLLWRLGRFSWTLHNVVAHPLMELCYLIGAHRVAHIVHDATIPHPPQGATDRRYEEEETNENQT